MMKIDIQSRRILGLLIIASIAGPAIYIGIQELQLFRIALLISTLFIIMIYSHKKLNVRDVNSIIVLAFFSFYFFWTISISIFLSNLNINDLFNFFILYLLILNIIFYINLNPKSFFDVLYKISILMFFIMFIIALWEIMTHNHLAVSTSNNVASYIEYMPTTFFTNPNDFAAILTMIILFSLYNNRIMQKNNVKLLLIMFIIAEFIAFITNSRLNILVLSLTFILYFIKPKYFLHILIITIIILGISIPIVDFIKTNDIFNIDYLIAGLGFGGDSTSVRSTLYLDAILSIEKNFGLGHGINSSMLYFLNLNDPALHGAVNTHNYVLELLINSGVVVFFFFILLNIFLTYRFIVKKMYFNIYLLFMYYIILMSSSSSLFLWYHYIFFLGLIINSNNLLLNHKQIYNLK